MLLEVQKGNAEIIESLKNGLLIPLGDVGKWVNMIQLLFSDFDLRKKFARAGRETLVEKFSLSRMVGDYEKCYLRQPASKEGSNG